jgi:hypothetical protein
MKTITYHKTCNAPVRWDSNITGACGDSSCCGPQIDGHICSECGLLDLDDQDKLGELILSKIEATSELGLIAEALASEKVLNEEQIEVVKKYIAHQYGIELAQDNQGVSLCQLNLT